MSEPTALEVLKPGAVICPRKTCKKTRLEFEQVQGMRTYQDVNIGKRFPVSCFSARCPQCGEHFKVRRS